MAYSALQQAAEIKTKIKARRLLAGTANLKEVFKQLSLL